MQNPHGSVVVNGIDDKELVRILEIKTKHEKSLIFNPQQLQTVIGAGNKPVEPQHYNNATFAWKDEEGLEAVFQIVSMLLKKEHQQEEVVA